MARVIGQVKSYENGTFFKKDSKGQVFELKSGDSIYEGEQVYGAQTNLANANIIIDVLLAGAGDLIISKDGSLTLDVPMLESVFSHHDAVIHLNSMQEAMAMAATASAESNIPSAEGTEAGNETAAGNVLTDTERMADVFDSRTGLVTDVTTDLRTTTSSTAATTAQPTEVTLLETEEPVPVNVGPSIDVVAYQSFEEGSAVAGDVAFTYVGSDPDTPADQLMYTLTNDNNGYLAMGAGNTIVLTEAGAAAINADNTILTSLTATVQVSDGSLTAVDSDITPVTPINDNEGLVLSTDTLNVAEAGLNPLGTHAAGLSEIAYGAFSVSDPDGLDDIKSLSIGSTTFTIGEGGIDNLSLIVGHSVDTGYGTVTITGYQNGVFDYKYTLDTNVNNTIAGATDTSYVEKFTVTVSDGIGESASQDISVVISDDVPLGNADSGIVANIANTTLSGDVGIVFGADAAAASPYSISVSTMPMGWESRVVNGEIYLWGPGDLVPESGSDGATAKFALDSDGQYTFTVLQELETTITPIPLSLTTLAPAGQPTAEKFVTNITLPNGDPLTITIHSTVGLDVNSSNDGLGVENPQVDAGESIYFDFSSNIADFTVNVGNFANNDTLLWTAYTYDSATSSYVEVATGSYDAIATNNSAITSVILSQSLETGSLSGGFDRIVFGAEVDSDHQVDDYNMMSAIVGVTETEVPNDASFVFSVAGTDSDGDSALSYIGVNIDANAQEGETSGDDLLSGSGVLIAGEGNDTLVGDETVGYLFGGEGNDTLNFDSTDTVIDGGAGTDTLILVGNTAIDFQAWDSSALKNIEVIDLTNGDHQLNNLSLNDVVSMTDANNKIYILGDAGDSVDFQNSNGWEVSSVTPTVTQNVNGIDHTFDVYVNADDPTVIVHVEQIITETI